MYVCIYNKTTQEMRGLAKRLAIYSPFTWRCEGAGIIPDYGSCNFWNKRMCFKKQQHCMKALYQ